MRRINAISLLVASALTIGALPAQAQGTTERSARPANASAACARSFANVRCASDQRRLIAAVQSSARSISVEETGKRQLDALMRTIG